MKKLISILLSIIILITSCSSALAMENSQEVAFYDKISSMLNETGYVLVLDGIPTPITENEYLDIISRSYIDTAGSVQPETEYLINDNPTSVQSIPSFFYKFVPSSSTWYASSTSYRVSQVFVSANVISISVSSTISKSRTVTYAGGWTITSDIKSAIFSGVETTYSYSSSATSTMDSTITGTFSPNTAYTYSAVMFQPFLRSITGTLSYYQNYGGSTTLLDSRSATAQYPKTVSGRLDGIYYIKGSNSYYGF